MPPNPAPQNTPLAARLLSLDALRGFDMMWIVGADAFGDAFRKFRGGAPARVLGEQLDHVEWAGFRFYDLIFPLFAFMIGVSITFSIPRLLEKEGRSAALRRIGRRTCCFLSSGFSTTAASPSISTKSGGWACCSGSPCVTAAPACFSSP